MTNNAAICPTVPERRWIVPFFLAACLLVYPNRLIFFAPHWIIFAFSTASISLLAIGLILLSGRATQSIRALPRFFLAAIVVFALIAAGHSLVNSGQYKLNDFARSIAYLSIPLFGLSFREELKRHLPAAMSVFWFFTVTQSIVEGILLDTDILAGLPMNINWNASLIAVSLPFVIYLILTKTAKKIFLRWSLIVLSVTVSAYILWICRSYAVFLAIPTVLVFCAIMRFGRDHWQKLILLLIAAALALGGIFLYLLICQPDLNGIDRIFFYRKTLDLIGDAPISGHGIPSFAQAFLPYRTEDFFALETAADHINHPHNHFLFMAAGMGIVGLLSWLILLFVPYFKFAFCKFKAAAAVERLVFFGFSILLLHSMADLVMFQVPTNLIALLFCGILWGCLSNGDPSGQAQTGKQSFTAKIPAVAGWFTAFIAVIMACANLYTSIHFRMGYRLAEKDPAGAAAHFNQAIIFSGWDNQLYYQYPIGEFYTNYEDLNNALYVLSLIENSPEPDYAHIHLLRGRIYLQKKEYATAVKEFLREAELYPLHPESLMYIWSIAVQRNQEPVIREAALELNRRFEKLLWDVHFDPEDPENITGSDIELLQGSLSDHKKVFRRLREMNKKFER